MSSMRKRLAAVLALALAVVAIPTHQAVASTVNPALSPTPYQGWNTYYGLGGDFTADQVLDVARSMKSRGLLAAGYDIVWLDGGWQATPYRSAQGDITADPARFPKGLKSLTDSLHAMGFRAGIYTDAGAKLTDKCGLGSGGGYQQRDANQFAAWGFDAIKVDFVCGWANKEEPEPAFRAMATAIRNNASGRPMVFSLCNPVTSPDWGDLPPSMQSTNSYKYAPQIAESWRTYTDIGFTGSIKYSDMLRNYDANAAHPEAAGPGHWNDPDYLGPELGMNATEFRTQMSLWAVAAAPLIIASDPRTLSNESIATLTNAQMLQIHRDRLGQQARRLGPAGDQEVWVKPLADGSRAVLFLNRSDQPAAFSTSVSALGLRGNRVSVTDVWNQGRTEANTTVRAATGAHGSTLVKVAPARTHLDPPRIVAQAQADQSLVAQGGTITANMTLFNDGSRPTAPMIVAPRLPKGWNARPRTVWVGRIDPGRSTTVRFTITIPANTPVGQVGLDLEAVGIDLPRKLSSPLSITIAPPVPTGQSDLAHHQWISATSGWMSPSVDHAVGGGSPLVIAGTTHATGIGVASPSQVRWYLGGKCSTLTGAAGIDDAVKFAPEGATVTFQIVGDGKVLFQSGVVRRDQLQNFAVPVAGVQDLRLQVGDGGDSGYNDRADWVDLQLSCP